MKHFTATSRTLAGPAVTDTHENFSYYQPDTEPGPQIIRSLGHKVTGSLNHWVGQCVRPVARPGFRLSVRTFTAVLLAVNDIFYDRGLQLKFYSYVRNLQLYMRPACYCPPISMGKPLCFIPEVSSFFFLFSSPIFSRRRLDVYHTSAHDVALG